MGDSIDPTSLIEILAAQAEGKVAYICPECGRAMIRQQDEPAPSGCDRCSWTLKQS